ncbi:MAG: hypothetical protein QNI99_20300 [Woeseiaceae bacterium]|nr:hypothetical protein [Woeseiaceae bacterium]
MSNLFFVVCIVAIACATAVATEWIKARKVRDEKSDDFDDAAAQIDALEERIRVLERIVTENKYDLRKEIDRL